MEPDKFIIIRDIFQILFFITIGIITVLSYLSAKKSILHPFKSELFKEQIKIFSNILSFFNKTELQLREEINYELLFKANFVEMMDEYAKYSFGLEIKREDRIYNSERTPYAQISDKTPVIKSSGYLKEHKIIENELSKNISKIDSWDNYNKYLIRLPKELIEYENKLSIIKNSPILPNKCQILIDEYLKIIFTNIKQVRELLNEASKELPFKYPTIEKFKDATVDWLWVRYTKIFLSLTPNSDKIIQFIRNYYDSEQVFK